MYCCITIRLTVGVTAADTLFDLRLMPLTVRTDLQVRGVLIPQQLSPEWNFARVQIS